MKVAAENLSRSDFVELEFDVVEIGIGKRKPAPAARLRVALLSYRSDPRVGGQGIFTHNIARALAKRGHAVSILSGPPYPEVPDGVGLVRLPSLDLFAQPLLGRYALRWRHLKSWTDTAEYFFHISGKFMEPWSFCRRAAAYLKTHAAQFDVVLDNQSLGHGLLDIAAMLPLAAVIHHPIRRDLEAQLASEGSWKRRVLARRWYGFLPMQEAVARRLDRVITVSDVSAAEIVDCMGVRRERIAVVPLGVDRSVFYPRPRLGGRLRIMTTASSDVPLKGLRYLLTAFAGLLKDWPEVALVIVGRKRAGPTQDLLEALGIGQSVEFVQDLSSEQMAEQYAAASICVVPSLYEGFGLPVVEAMACGTPVIATDGGALPEVVGDAGVIVPAGDAAALRAALDALLRDSERALALAAAGLRRVRERYGWDRVGEAYEGLLRQAIAAKC
jgi:glycosyltransferase involved in cell wall biosynthesis